MISNGLHFAADELASELVLVLVAKARLLGGDAIDEAVVFAGENGVERSEQRIFVRTDIAGEKHLIAGHRSVVLVRQSGSVARKQVVLVGEQFGSQPAIGAKRGSADGVGAVYVRGV